MDKVFHPTAGQVSMPGGGGNLKAAPFFHIHKTVRSK